MQNNLKYEIKYLTIYLISNSIGVFIASKMWLADNLELSYFKKEIMLLLLSTAICWFGILHLSIFIVRKFILKIDINEFYGLIRLTSNNFLKAYIGEESALKFKKFFSLISFSVLLITITAFISGNSLYKNYQLKNFGKVEEVTVIEIHKDAQENPYIFFKYNNGKSSTNIYNEGYNIGDKINIIYSVRNPKVVELQNN